MDEMLGSCEGRSRWKQPFVLWVMAAAVTGEAVFFLLPYEKLSSPTRTVLGFLPTLLWVFCVVALVRKVRTQDEMVKRIHLQAASIAFVATVVLN
jgi:hypothetical protein